MNEKLYSSENEQQMVEQQLIETNLSKLERPRSLSINTTINEDQSAATLLEEQTQQEINSIENNQPTLLMVDPNFVEAVEEKLSKLDVNSTTTTPGSIIIDGGGKKGKKADNLTDQGYVDLKFYHSKLW